MTTISFASVGVMSYLQMSNTIESDAIAKMVAVEESMGQALDKQFELIDADLRVLGNYNLTRDALVRLNAGFENLRKEGENPARFLQDAYITNTQHPVGQRHLEDMAEDGSYYTKFHAKYHDVFRWFMLEYMYYDVFLMDMDGDVVYSVYKENDFAMNVEQAQDRGMLFSLGYDHTQVEKSRFLPSDSNVSHEPTRSRTRMAITFKHGSWSVFDGLTMMGKEFKDQDGEQVLGSIRHFSRF